MCGTSTEVAAMEDATRHTVRHGLLEEEEGTTGTVIRWNHCHFGTPCSWHFGWLIPVQLNHPLRCSPQLILHQASRHLAAVNWAVSPVCRQPDIMITVEMTQKVCIAVLHSPISESVYTYVEVRHDLVERTCSFVCWTATCGILSCRRVSPCCVFDVTRHKL